MHIISARNVNEAFALGVRLVREEGRLEETRAGAAMVVPVPVVTVLTQPTERVLLDPVRDANPFFHIFEGLHMLAGRRDYTWLDRFVKDFSARFAEEDGDGHGAYGWRWRKHFEVDQLDTVVSMLRQDPSNRRVVITMWDPDADLLDPSDIDDETGKSFPLPKDLPCNDMIFPRIVDGALDLTVCCRSNDLIWGLCGANAVHFSMLQEYLAGRIGCGVGTLRTLSNNLHAYVGVLEKQDPEWVRGRLDPVEGFVKLNYPMDAYRETDSVGVEVPHVEPIPIGTDWAQWDEDLAAFMRWTDDGQGDDPPDFVNGWFYDVAYHMWMTHVFYKAKANPDALNWAREITAPDWRRACTEWLERRVKP